MAADSFSLAFVENLIARSLRRVSFVEDSGAGGGPLLPLASAADASVSAGSVRLWAAPPDTLADRMIHFRLTSGPVETQLFFLFGRPESVLPHLHIQVVQFSPDACVFNADFLPRLDPVDHPDYFRTVFDPLNTPYWKAVNEYSRICSHAPGNPALAALLAPWSISTSRPAPRAELDAVTPSIHAFLDHWLGLAKGLRYDGVDPEALRDRDARHLAGFFDEKLDPRAWKGVYAIIGVEAGHRVRELIQRPRLG